jgi:membrane-associated phospholipid phosphatase
MNEHNITVNIGIFGPSILFIFACFKLMWNYDRILLYYYIVGSAVNVAVNTVLKQLLQYPKPTQPSNGDKSVAYGMPSCHTQSVGFTIAYLSNASQIENCAQSNILRYGLTAFLGITSWQRVAYKHSTVGQVAVGAIIGVLIGYTIYAMPI